MTSWQFQALGPLAVLRDGVALRLPPQRPRALLALLLLHARVPVSSGQLIEELWDGHPPPSARAALQMHVSALRRALGPTLPLKTTSSGYLLDVTDDQIDVACFEQGVKRAFGLLRGGDAHGGVEQLRECLGLWRGRPFSEFDDLTVARDAADRLEELRIVALEERIDGDLGRGLHTEVIGELASLVREHPYRERLRAQLMLSLYRAGRQAEALDAYRDARRRLVEDLGIEPGPDLRRLEEAILAQDAVLALDGKAPSASRYAVKPDAARIPLPKTLPRRTGGSMVGRERELERLLHVWRHSGTDAPTFIALIGEAGIGKTRLATEFAMSGYGDGARVLYGRCDQEGLVSYQPWVEALSHFVAHVGSDEQARIVAGAPDIARLLPPLASRIAVAAAPMTDDPETERYRLFDAVVSVLESCAGEPLILVLEDLHWADPPTLLLLRHVLRAAHPPASLLVVATFRDVHVDAGHPLTLLLGDLQRDGSLESIELAGLTEADVATLVGRHHGREDERFARRLFRETAGNPFFIGEVLRNTPADGAHAAVPVPDSVRHAIRSRVARLSAPARTVLSVAAVVGPRFRLDVLEQVIDMGADDLVDALDEALAARLITETSEAAAGWAFFHALTRAALYEELSRTRRARWHLRIGEGLERVAGRHGDVPVAELAHHFLEAVPVGGAERAVMYAAQAGEEASRRLAYEDAVAHLRRAREALGVIEGDTSARELDLLLALGDAEHRAGNLDESRATFEAAAALASQREDHVAFARAALGRAGPTLLAFAEVDGAAIKLLDEALERLPQVDGPDRARVLARLAIAIHFVDVTGRARALTREAVAMSRRLGDPAVLADTLEAQGWAAFNPDGAHHRLTIADELLSLSQDLSRDDLQARARRWRITTLLELGRIGDVRDEVATYRQLVERLGGYEEVYSYGFERLEALLAGQWELALQPPPRPSGKEAQQSMSVIAVNVAFETGQLGTLVPIIAAAVESDPHIPAWRCALCLAQAEAGEVSAARKLYDRLSADRFRLLPRDANWMIGMALLVLTAQRLGGRTGTEQALYDALAPYGGRLVIIGFGGVTWGPVDYYLGVVAAALGDHERARTHLESTLHFARTSGAITWEARAEKALATSERSIQTADVTVTGAETGS